MTFIFLLSIQGPLDPFCYSRQLIRLLLLIRVMGTAHLKAINESP